MTVYAPPPFPAVPQVILSMLLSAAHTNRAPMLFLTACLITSEALSYLLSYSALFRAFLQVLPEYTRNDPLAFALQQLPQCN